MFLIRVAFWLSVVVMLLPTGGSNKTAGQDDVGATQALSAAGAALADMRGFCSRQPDACAIGSQVATTFGYKAQAGAKMLYEFLNDKMAPTETGSITAHNDTDANHATASRDALNQDTLTADDRSPKWVGPEQVKLPRPKGHSA